jgi:hypothetical protein
MHPPLLAAANIHFLWYALPLIVAISLVYAATKHEAMGPILQHAWRIGLWIVGFMVAIFVVLELLLLGVRGG